MYLFHLVEETQQSKESLNYGHGLNNHQEKVKEVKLVIEE